MDNKRMSSTSGTPDHSTERDRGDYKPNKTRRRRRKKSDVDYNSDPSYKVENDMADVEANKVLGGKEEASLVNAYPEPSQHVMDSVTKHRDSMGGYRKEYEMKLLHRMLMRNMPVSAIASAMKCSVKKVRDMRTELYAALKAEARNFDTDGHVGEALGFYQEVRGIAMRLATDNKNTTNSRVSALNVALEAQKDTVRFLQAVGTYDERPMSYTNTDDVAVSEGDMLKKLAESFLMDNEDECVVIDEEGSVIDIIEDEEDFKLLGGM